MPMRAFLTTLSATVFLAAATTPTLSNGEIAVAVLKMANGSDAGTITLTEATGVVLLKFDLKGLKPGPHALHIHEAGKCDGDFSSAGGIYNPLGAKHGFLVEEGPMAGDLPNIVAAADGTAVGELMSSFINLRKDAEESLFAQSGTSVVLFDKADDYQTDPEGGAAPRIACGVLKAQ